MFMLRKHGRRGKGERLRVRETETETGGERDTVADTTADETARQPRVHFQI